MGSEEHPTVGLTKQRTVWHGEKEDRSCVSEITGSGGVHIRHFERAWFSTPGISSKVVVVQCHRNAVYDTRGTDTDVRALVDHGKVLLSAEIDSVPNIPFFYLVFRAWSHWRG